MKKEIDLEEILNSIVENTNPHGDRVFFKEDILKAMKEACNQCLTLAAENAEISWIENNIEMESGSDFSFRDSDCNWCGISIKEDSILQIKDRIK